MATMLSGVKRNTALPIAALDRTARLNLLAPGKAIMNYTGQSPSGHPFARIIRSRRIRPYVLVLERLRAEAERGRVA
jgi:hypothetical protein